MLRRLAPTLTLAVVLAACSGGPPPEPPAPPPLDPSGVYDITVETSQGAISGVMSIEGSPEEGYTGSVNTDMGGATMSDIVVEGQELTFQVPEAGVQVRLVFDDDGFSGGMTGAMGEGMVYGTKRPEG